LKNLKIGKECFMEVYKFIVWADTHWDKFASKCVTLDDTDIVERAIFERAVSGGFDFTLFAGDRYLKREPDDETKVRADRVIYDLVHTGNIPHFHLIGNHDWVDNTRKWHTAESLKLFNNVYVMDQAKTWKYKNVRIHSLPADFEMDMSQYEIDPSCLNLFVFHDMVAGTFMNEDRTMSFDSGMPLSDIDRPEFDFVFAGDIHIRQPFPFQNTYGGYLGSVVQRTRADSNRERGWTEMTFTKSGSKWERHVK
jgi:DNA repair exonuclease SbcCD nuclease subunit